MFEITLDSQPGAALNSCGSRRRHWRIRDARTPQQAAGAATTVAWAVIETVKSRTKSIKSPCVGLTPNHACRAGRLYESGDRRRLFIVGKGFGLEMMNLRSRLVHVLKPQ